MTIPKDLKYTEEHEWLKVEGVNVKVGITDFAQAQLGDIVFIEIPEVGRVVTKGEAFSAVESVKAVSDIFAPVSGVIVAVNDSLADAPEVVNSDPYGGGWIVIIEAEKREDITRFLDSEEYHKVTMQGGH